MIANLFIGFVTMTICLSIQCAVVAVLLRQLIDREKKGSLKLTLFHVSYVLSLSMLILLAGNMIQITIWSILFFGLREFNNLASVFYHSVVNFATLGYGDIVMSENRRLLGALEAVNGVLMFGLTTGSLYTILSSFLQRSWNEQLGKQPDS